MEKVVDAIIGLGQHFHQNRPSQCVCPGNNCLQSTTGIESPRLNLRLSKMRNEGARGMARSSKGKSSKQNNQPKTQSKKGRGPSPSPLSKAERPAVTSERTEEQVNADREEIRNSIAEDLEHELFARRAV